MKLKYSAIDPRLIAASRLPGGQGLVLVQPSGIIPGARAMQAAMDNYLGGGGLQRQGGSHRPARTQASARPKGDVCYVGSGHSNTVDGGALLLPSDDPRSLQPTVWSDAPFSVLANDRATIGTSGNFLMLAANLAATSSPVIASVAFTNASGGIFTANGTAINAVLGGSNPTMGFSFQAGVSMLNAVSGVPYTIGWENFARTSSASELSSGTIQLVPSSPSQLFHVAFWIQPSGVQNALPFISDLHPEAGTIASVSATLPGGAATYTPSLYFWTKGSPFFGLALNRLRLPRGY